MRKLVRPVKPRVLSTDTVQAIADASIITVLPVVLRRPVFCLLCWLVFTEFFVYMKSAVLLFKTLIISSHPMTIYVAKR